jgi:hypothetical protein
MSIVFANTSTGGAVARGGFEYQDAYALLNFPTWLSQDAFSGMVSELLGDMELTYYSTGLPRHLCMEAKNHGLTNPEFWAEIAQFETLHASSPDTYIRFRYVSTATPAALAPMRNMLDRLRNVVEAYAEGHPLRLEAEEEIVQWIIDKAKQSRARAEFVVRRVEFDDFDGDADQRFLSAFAEALPSLADVPPSRVSKVKEKWERLIAHSAKGHVSRNEIEEQMLLALNDTERAIWMSTASQPLLRCGATGEHVPGSLDMAIDMRPYIDDTRALRTEVEWDELHRQSEAMGEFLATSRPRKRVRLNANLRMSAAVVLGSAFKATKGHALQIEHRGNLFSLDDYTERSEPYFKNTLIDGGGAEGVVSIQIGALTRADVQHEMSSLGLASAPSLYIESEEGIANIQTLNRAVTESKRTIATFRSNAKLTKLHLIIKGPSFFAAALGHRLNGLGSIQLYDWTGARYSTTALLQR